MLADPTTVQQFFFLQAIRHQIYQSGNLYDGVRDADFNDAIPVTWSHFTGTETQLANPLSVTAGVIDSTTTGRDRVLAYSGAQWWSRNSTDTRIIDSVSAGTGSIINSVPTAEWNDVVNASQVNRPDGWDTDEDGMPDSWELAHDLAPLIADNNGDFDSDGYTNLEEYLNEIAEWPAPRAIVFNAATNDRYAQITNWDIQWQPSRFDTAVINQGTVTVDAVGQHAGNLLLATNPGDNATLDITAGWIKVEDAPYGLSDGITVIGDTPTSTAEINLSGGKLTTKSLLKGDGGKFNFTGGTLSADMVGFDLVNNGGTIAPGDSPGVTQVMGDLSINSGSLQIELGGAGPGEFDEILIDGEANLGGSLDVSLLNDFQPNVGQFFQIVTTTGGIFYEFDAVHLPTLLGGKALRLVYGETLVGLEVVTGLPGDFDFDGDVDGRDFLLWQRNPSVGDLSDWQANYGAPLTANSLAVPEPATAYLCCGLGLFAFNNRRRK